MRKFYLWTYDMSEKFDLNSKTLYATNPKGLGNTFDIAYLENESGQYWTNIKPKFDNITLDIYFNASNSQGYINYKMMMNFLSKVGMSPFIFEYNDGITDKFCEVILRSAPKTQIDDNGVFSETFEFERQSWWYEIVSDSFTLKATDAENSTFPLLFPFAFSGQHLYSEYTIKNNFFIDAPIEIKISGTIANNVYIYIKNKETNEIVQELQLSRGCVDGTTITIDPHEKQITVDEKGVQSNGYELTDKTKQSFLYLPKGEYLIGTNIEQTDKGSIDFTIRRYILD